MIESDTALVSDSEKKTPSTTHHIWSYIKQGIVNKSTLSHENFQVSDISNSEPKTSQV